MKLKSIGHLFLALTFFFTNALTVHSTEANFWAERRTQAKRQHVSAPGAVAPGTGAVASGGSSSMLLAQVPGAQPVGLDGNIATPSFDLPAKPVGDIQLSDLKTASLALTRDGSADWLDPLVNPYGTVREIHLSKKADSPLIIHIQDVHGYADAQKNISGMIDGLSKYRGVNLIGMEAAEGAFALEDLRRFPDRDIKERVTNWAITKDLIGGAEKSGIMAEKPLTLWGVENTALYKSNVQAVKESLARRSEAQAFHRELEKNLARLKSAVYSEDLKKYDDNLLAYQDKRRGLGDYLKHLAGQWAGGQAGLTHQFPNTAMLLKALDQEAALDFKQVERERVDLVERLAARLDEKTLNGLVSESMAYRAGRVTYGRYYAYVKDLCRQGKIDLAKFPGLTDYIAYVGLSERINRERLLSELENLEDRVANQLARTDLERGVLSLSRDGVLLGKLMNNAMTPEDWGRYLIRRGEILSLDARFKILSQEGKENKEFPSPLGRPVAALPAPGAAEPPMRGRGEGPEQLRMPQNFAEFVKPFEEFCRLALARNEAFADRLFAKMGQDNVKTAVLVTGGFHTEGLMAEIDRRGGSYVVLTPRVEIVQSDKNYLDAFAHDPVPLEKLFDGEKISILTERTTTAAAGQSEEVTGPQKIGLAMLGEAVQSWFRGLRGENRSLREIANILKARLEKLLGELGGLYQKMGITVEYVSQNGWSLRAIIAGVNYQAGSSIGGDGLQVSLPPTASFDGLENAYTKFAKTRFGAWLKKYNQAIFQAVAEIFVAPGVEKPLTKNLIAFGKMHGFENLPIRPLGGIAMFDGSTNRKSVARSLGGWVAIATMGMAGFSPTIAAFYFTFVDPAGVFSSAIALALFAFVVLVNYIFRTDFYLVPHGFINAIIIGAHGVFSFLNQFIPQLTFRFARLTLSEEDQNLKQLIEVTLKLAQHSLSDFGAQWDNKSVYEKNMAARDYWYIRDFEYALNCQTQNEMDAKMLNMGVPSELVDFWRGLTSNHDLIVKITKFDDENKEYLQALSRVIEKIRNSKSVEDNEIEPAMYGILFLQLLLNTKVSGFDRAPGEYLRARFNSKGVNKIYPRNANEFFNPFDFEKSFSLYLFNQLMEESKALLAGQAGSTPFSSLSEEEFDRAAQSYRRLIWLIKFRLARSIKLFTQQEVRDLLKEGFSITGPDLDKYSAFVFNPSIAERIEQRKSLKKTGGDENINSRSEQEKKESEKRNRAQQLEKRINEAQNIIGPAIADWEHQDFNTRKNAANHYWGLRFLTAYFDNDQKIREAFLTSGVSEGAVRNLLSIIHDKTVLNLVKKFDEGNREDLVALLNLFQVYLKNSGFAEVDLNRAREGYRFIQEHLQGAPGLKIHDNLYDYIDLRFGSDLSPLGGFKTRALILMTPQQTDFFLRQMMWRRNFEIALRLLPDSGIKEYFNNADEFEGVVDAYNKIWNQLQIEFHDFFKEEDISQQEQFLRNFLGVLKVPAEMVDRMANMLRNRTGVESFVAQKRDGIEADYAFVEPQDLFDNNNGDQFSYLAPVQIILKFVDRPEIIVVWIYKGKDLPIKYRSLLGPTSVDPEGYFVATQRGRGEAGMAVAPFGNGEKAILCAPSAYMEDQRIINGSANSVAEVSLMGNGVNVKVEFVDYVRLGFPIATNNGAEHEKSFSFVIEKNSNSFIEDEQIPISISEEQKRIIAAQIQQYINSLSSFDPDDKLLLEFFNRTRNIVVHIGKKFLERRFTFRDDQIRIDIEEGEIARIINGELFSNERQQEQNGALFVFREKGPVTERFKGIKQLLSSLRMYDQILGMSQSNLFSLIIGYGAPDSVKKKYSRLVGLIHWDKGQVPDDRASQRLSEAYNIIKSGQMGPNTPGAFLFWEYLGIRNLARVGVLETLVDLLVAVYFIPAHLPVASSASIAQLGLAALDVTGSLFLILLVGKFFIHFLGGVSQPGGLPAKTWRNTGIPEMFSISLGATFTASKSLAMLPFVAVSWFIFPMAPVAAIFLGIFGFVWGAYSHMMANYRAEVAAGQRSNLAQGVTIISSPVTADGKLVSPKATVSGMLQYFMGGRAGPVTAPAGEAIYALEVATGVNGRVDGGTIDRNPEAWIAEKALAVLQANGDSKKMEETMRFLNMVVFYSKRLSALAGQQPGSPLLIEVPSQAELENPTIQMALAAVLMAHGESESLKDHPLALVARGQVNAGDQGWNSDQAVRSAAVEALAKYAPETSNPFASRVADGTVKIVRAVDSLITVQGEQFKYNLGAILDQIYPGKNFNSVMVLGVDGHFNLENITATVLNYFNLAAQMVESMKEKTLFLTAA